MPLVTNTQRVKKLRSLFRNIATHRDVASPFVVGVDKFVDRMHHHGELYRFYGCFGVHDGHPLHYELLGWQMWHQLPEHERPFSYRFSKRRIEFFSATGLSYVRINIVCQDPEAYRFGYSILSRTDELQGRFANLMC